MMPPRPGAAESQTPPAGVEMLKCTRHPGLAGHLDGILGLEEFDEGLYKELSKPE
jgi:hypothetical protein